MNQEEYTDTSLHYRCSECSEKVVVYSPSGAEAAAHLEGDRVCIECQIKAKAGGEVSDE